MPSLRIKTLPLNKYPPFGGFLARCDGGELPCPLSALPETMFLGDGADASLGILDLISRIAGGDGGFEHLARRFWPVHQKVAEPLAAFSWFYDRASGSFLKRAEHVTRGRRHQFGRPLDPRAVAAVLNRVSQGFGGCGHVSAIIKEQDARPVSSSGSATNIWLARHAPT